jgi:hypothetical protein
MCAKVQLDSRSVWLRRALDAMPDEPIANAKLL